MNKFDKSIVCHNTIWNLSQYTNLGQKLLLFYMVIVESRMVVFYDVMAENQALITGICTGIWTW